MGTLPNNQDKVTIGGLETTYSYTDAQGDELYQVVRKHPKQFLTRTKVGNEWVWNLAGIDRVPYRLHDLLRVEEAVVVEGEKDAETLRAHGIVATTSAGGASWEWPQEWAEYFAHLKTVFVLADNDDAGRKAAAERAEVIGQTCSDVRVVLHIPDVGEKGDVTDYLEAGEDIERLLGMAKPIKREFIPGGQFILAETDDPEPLWGSDGEQLWSSGESLWICGPTGVGKTTLAQQVVLGRIGLRKEVLGFPIKESTAKVLYIAADRPRQAKRSMRRMITPNEEAILNDRLVFRTGPLDFDVRDDPDGLIDLCVRAGADTIVIDSMKDVALDLSKDETGSRVNLALGKLVAAGIEVMVLHHQRKTVAGTSGPKKIDDIYGSTWLVNGAGSVISIEGTAGDGIFKILHLKQPIEEVGPLEIEHDYVRGHTTLSNSKTPYDLIRAAPLGLSAADLAMVLFAVPVPDAKAVKKAQRKIDVLVKKGKVAIKDGTGTRGVSGGKANPAIYVATTTRRELS